jgi:DNA 3'-phosphatase
VVILINQLERDPAFTKTSLDRIDNFVAKLFDDPKWQPYIYVSTADDNYRKPNIGMWEIFLQDASMIGKDFKPSEASFYCGDAVGPNAQNPIYRWSNIDILFAQNCQLSFYNPDELIGPYVPPDINPQTHKILLIMAADPSQYEDFIQNLPQYQRFQTINEALPSMKNNQQVIITGERLATQAGRRRMIYLIPKELQINTYILMFTRPIKPFVTDQQYRNADMTIRGYANALDFHPSQNYPFELEEKFQPRTEPFPILRIN